MITYDNDNALAAAVLKATSDLNTAMSDLNTAIERAVGAGLSVVVESTGTRVKMVHMQRNTQLWPLPGDAQ